MSTLTIQYDDNSLDVIDKVNLLLKKHGLWFEDDGKEHDGYVSFELINTIETDVDEAFDDDEECDCEDL